MTLQEDESLFGAVHVPIRRGAANYLHQLHQLSIIDPRPGAWEWTFWALAEPENLWRVPGPIPEYEYMWLLDPASPPSLHKALVHLDTGRIIRRRPYRQAAAQPTSLKEQRAVPHPR